jgi:hypothetical protein
MWDLWWTMRHCGTFSPSTSVSPASHSLDRLEHTRHRPSPSTSRAGAIDRTAAYVPSGSVSVLPAGWCNRPNSGLRAEWISLSITSWLDTHSLQISNMRQSRVWECTSSDTRCYVRSVDLTAVTVKNVVLCDISTQFVSHRRHITSPLQSPAG